MDGPLPNVVVCNGAHYTTPIPSGGIATGPLFLDYRQVDGTAPNINILLPKFVQSLYFLPDRLLDLLEIAAYVYCADRYVNRGGKDDLEYHAWAPVIPVSRQGARSRILAAATRGPATR